MDSITMPAQGTLAFVVASAVIAGILIGVFGKKAAETLQNFILRLASAVWEPIYNWIAPRNPISVALRSYKKHVGRSWLTKIENPVGPKLDVPLEHAFAPLKLISSSAKEGVELFSLVSISNRCIVLGGPGTGKTTLMKSLVIGIIKNQAREETLNDLIPVFVTLRKLASSEHTVQQAVVAAFAEHHFPGAERFVESALSQGKMLIILDGLDEVGASRLEVSQQIISFCEYDDQRPHKNRVVVTCRENSYRTEDLRSVISEVVRVEPFSNHHMRVFLEGWPTHKERSALKLYMLIQNDSQIRDICRNPLLLTILTGLYLESDNFRLPASRDQFYKAAIDELLIKRPERRGIKQRFDAADKRQVLERVSLRRLETVHLRDDPEELNQDMIRQQAHDVLANKEVNVRDFIRELVEVNGIIRSTSDDVYTCAHRTIQEYFAAREARRTRTSEEVIAHFSNRPDLIHVLYFYCGLINNIPQLSFIVDTFSRQNRWLEAGTCLLHMTEMPDGALVERIIDNLHHQIKSGNEFAALEIMSSLAQRPNRAFDAARKRFSEAVDLLAEGKGTSNATALESALAASPEVAMRLIPGLLTHKSLRWQAAGVQLLRDIGTDEALDQLVQLLDDENEFVRSEAGKILAGMIKSRGRDMKPRAALLREREYSVIWPFEAYFPGKLALRLAESLATSALTTNRAINNAATAIRAVKYVQGDVERRFLKQWRRVPRDRNLREWRISTGKTLVSVSILALFTYGLAAFSLQIWAHMKDAMVIVDLKTLQAHTLDGRFLRDIETQVEEIIGEIEKRYRPNASGLSRVLPWNWFVEPVIPENGIEAFNSLMAVAERRFDLQQLSGNVSPLINMSVLIPEKTQGKLEVSITAISKHLPHMSDSIHIIFWPAREAGFYFLLKMASLLIPLLVMLVVMISAVRVRLLYRLTERLALRPKANIHEGVPHAVWPKDHVGPFMFEGYVMVLVALMLFGGLSVTVSGVAWVPNTQHILVILSSPILLCLAVGYCLIRLDWPNNDLVLSVVDLLPPSPAEMEKAK